MFGIDKTKYFQCQVAHREKVSKLSILDDCIRFDCELKLIEFCVVWFCCRLRETSVSA